MIFSYHGLKLIESELNFFFTIYSVASGIYFGTGDELRYITKLTAPYIYKYMFLVSELKTKRLMHQVMSFKLESDLKIQRHNKHFKYLFL